MEKILLVDDEEKIIQVMKAYLEKEEYIVLIAENGKQALKIWQEENPSLIVLDLMLPDISGEEVCLAIREKSSVPILMLTAKAKEDDILAGFCLGTDDYLTKPFSPRELVARIKALLRRSARDNLSKSVSFNAGDLEIDFESCEVRKKGALIALTANELKILLTMAKNHGKLYSRSELIYAALGYDYEGYDRTIDTHIKNIRQKIEDDTKSPVYLLTIYGLGYKFGGTIS